MNNIFMFFKMAIKIAESALKRRFDRVSGISGNTGIFFLGLMYSCNCNPCFQGRGKTELISK